MAITKKKWITYGIAGAVGLSLVGGAAAATAANMSLQTDEGTVVPGGAVVGKKGDVLDRPGGFELRVTDTSVSVVSSPSATTSPTVSANSVASVASASSAVNAPAPVAPPAPAPAPAQSYSAPSAPSAPSAASVGSAWSN